MGFWESIFWISVFFIGYSYVIYPMILLLLRRPSKPAEYLSEEELPSKRPSRGRKPSAPYLKVDGDNLILTQQPEQTKAPIPEITQDKVSADSDFEGDPEETGEEELLSFRKESNESVQHRRARRLYKQRKGEYDSD